MVAKLIQNTPKNHNLRVCAYVRVSTDSESQVASLENQKAYFEQLYKTNSEFVGIYFDQGVSGLKSNRPGFQAMIQDCLEGKINLIHTKSISRFARNTELLLETTRRLKEHNVDIYFEEHNIHTLSSDGEIMLSVLASLAEEELASMSANQRWAFQKKFQRGELVINTKRFLGYDVDEHGELVINPKEAEIVKRIYNHYLEGYGMHRIAKLLNKESIPTVTGARWHDTTIRNILRNEKYKGSALLQKYFHDGVNGKKRLNQGQIEQYLIEDNHEAIISTADWQTVQDKLNKNSRKQGQNKIYRFTGLLKCQYCGSTLKRQVSYKGKIVWCCSKYIHEGKQSCQGMRVPEMEIKDWLIEKPTIVKEVITKNGKKHYSYSSEVNGNGSRTKTSENSSSSLLSGVNRTRRTAIKL